MNLQRNLERYAKLLVRVGLNVQHDQHLLIDAPLEAAALVREVSACAYQAGAHYVNVLWSDEAVARTRYRHARRDTSDGIDEARSHRYQLAAQRRDAVLLLSGETPGAFDNEDQQFMAQTRKAARIAGAAFAEATGSGRLNWCIAAVATPKWADVLFSDLEPAARLDAFWQAIFQTVRLHTEDPVAAWQDHLARLEKRSAWLNTQRFATLELRGGGTELSVGLADGHLWRGGAVACDAGFEFVPNLPTEEVFTMPHRERTHGVVRSSKPLMLAGSIVDGIEMHFEAGRVTHFSATRNQDVLRKALETDDGAKRLGEIALVAASSPIGASGLIFQNTLFDENAACHLALGRGLGMNLPEGADFAAAGGNDSLLHIDWMVGHAGMDVDGIDANNQRHAVMRAGEFVIDQATT